MRFFIWNTWNQIFYRNYKPCNQKRKSDYAELKHALNYRIVRGSFADDNTRKALAEEHKNRIVYKLVNVSLPKVGSSRGQLRNAWSVGKASVNDFKKLLKCRRGKHYNSGTKQAYKNFGGGWTSVLLFKQGRYPNEKQTSSNYNKWLWCRKQSAL